MLRPAVLAATILAGLNTVEAGTTYGCWSDQGAKFPESCVVALTALVTRFSVYGKIPYASIPSWKAYESHGNCKVNIQTKQGSSVKISDLLSSFDQLASRCQNGYFYYDSSRWLNAEVQGHSFSKRSGDGNETATDDDDDGGDGDLNDNKRLPTAAITWTQEELVKPLAIEETSAPEQTTKRQHTKDLIVRAEVFGTYVRREQIRGRSFSLFRTTGFVADRMLPAYTDIVEFFPPRLVQMIRGNLANTGQNILRIGIAQSNQASVAALAVAFQLGSYSNWQAMFQNMGDQGTLMGIMFGHALDNFKAEYLTGGVYNLYNEHNDVVVTIILNGVEGRVSALPH